MRTDHGIVQLPLIIEHFVRAKHGFRKINTLVYERGIFSPPYSRILAIMRGNQLPLETLAPDASIDKSGDETVKR